MSFAKLLNDDEGQVVCLPKECCFEGVDEVCIGRQGEIVYIFPKSKEQEVFSGGLDMFTDSFLADTRIHAE